MAVAFDAATESHNGSTGSASQASFTWDHTGGASARAALVYVFSIGALTDTSVTYGGTTMAAVPYTAADTDTEPGSCRAYFLDNVATGTQAVVVNRTNNAVVMYAVAFTVTAATATEVYNPGIMTAGGSTSNTGASSSGTGTGTVALKSVDDGSPGSNSLRFMGRYQGTSNVTAAGAGSTAGPSIDFGLFVIDTFRETTPGQGARNVGGATITDDVAAIALAVRELARTSVNAGLASITATASGPTDHLADFPSVAAVTLTGRQATSSEGVLPTAASLATTAQAPTAAEGVLPTAASLSVTGRDTTIETLTVTAVNAGLASITATASGAADSIGAEPGVSSATLSAQAPTAAEGLAAGNASLVTSAQTPTIAEGVLPTAAAVTLTGRDTTVQAFGVASPTAEAASLSTTANAPVAALGTESGSASVTVAAGTPAVAVNQPADGAAASLTGHPPTASVSDFAEAAAVTISAADASVGKGVTPSAASLTATAADPTPALYVPASVASLVVAAYNAAIDTSTGGTTVNAGLSALTVSAYDATVATVEFGVAPTRRHGGAPLNAATVIGPATRRRRIPLVTVNAQLASLGLRAHNASTTWNDDETALLLLLGVL